MLRLFLPLLLILAACGALGGEEKRQSRRQFVQCPQLHGDSVCPTIGARARRFSYNNGCNRVLCMGDGKWATVTRRSCPNAESAEEIEACGELASAVLKSAHGGGKAESDQGQSQSSDSGKRRRRSDQEFACPALAASAICQRLTNGFSYWDGCNAVKCHQDGTSMTTMKYCPAPDDAAGEAYCANAEKEMLAKKQRSSVYRRCLEAEAVCQGQNVRQKSYNDGCNTCRCIGEGEAACTRSSCPQVLMTAQEFAEFCKERGSGEH